MDPAASTLIALARQVRTRTLALLSGAEPSWLLWRPPGTSNHIIWHAGHALWVQDAICVEELSGESHLPAGWGARFGMDSRPGNDPGPWPSREEVARLLTEQLPLLERLISAATPARLRADPPSEKGEGCGWNILHGFHDEAIHQGEIYLIMKLCRRNPPK